MSSSTLSRRGFLSMGLAVSATVGAGLLTGCTPGVKGGSSAESADVDPNAAKPAQLRMLYATAEANSAAVQALLPAFKQKFGFDLVMDTQPYDALQQKVFSEFASKSPYYDIVIVDTPWAPALVAQLEPLSGHINNTALNDMADVDVKDFIPKVFFDTAVYNANEPVTHFADETSAADIAAITSAGFDVYGLPLQANAQVMAYRKDMFADKDEQAKFKAATGKDLTVPQTWDDFVEVAHFFTRPDQKMYGTTVMAGVGDWATDDFKSLLAAYGGQGRLVGDDLSLAFNSEQGVAALQRYADLINKDKVTPPGSTAASWDEAASLFDSGTTALTMNYHALQLDQAVKGEIGYAVVPKQQDRGPHFGTWMLSVNKFGANRAWAYRAITWLTAAEQQLTMTDKQLHPSRTSVYDKVTAAKDKGEAEFYKVLGDSLAVGVGRARLTNYSEVSASIAKAVNSAATGSTTPEAALKSAADQVRKLLTDAGYKVPA
jgi:multiple sugar transport system substrate-binding protein